MPEDTKWMQVTQHWRSLPLEERRRRHLEAIPRHVANSMAMEGEPVDEAWIRERLARFILGHSQHPLVKATHACRIPQRSRSVSAKAEKSLWQARAAVRCPPMALSAGG